MATNSPDDKVFALLARAAKSDEAAANLRGVTKLKVGGAVEWRGRACVPPGTLLDRVVTAFERGTNIALELAMLVTLHTVAAYLLCRGVYLERGGSKVHPTLWSLLLAPSGAGKTYTQKTVANGIGAADLEIQGLSGAASAAALLQCLQERPVGLWVRDEFGQFVARFDRGDSCQNELKDTMLRLYDGSPLFRRSVTQGSIEVPEPKVSLLALSVLESWPDCVSPSSMVDGFASRFAYFIGEPDPLRPAREFPEWVIDTSSWKTEWARLCAHVQSVYRTTPEAVAFFHEQFRTLYDDELPEAFSRRLLWSAHRLALVYHVLAVNPSPEIGQTDYGWAFRLIRLQLVDARRVMGETTMGELQRLLAKAETLADRFDAEGRVLTKRDLIRGVRGIANVAMAEGIFRVLWPEAAREGRKFPSPKPTKPEPHDHTD